MNLPPFFKKNVSLLWVSIPIGILGIIMFLGKQWFRGAMLLAFAIYFYTYERRKETRSK